MEVMAMTSSGQGHGQGHGENDLAPVPRSPSKLPSLLSGDEHGPGGSSPPPSAATGPAAGGSRSTTAVELPRLVGMNTLNPAASPDKADEKEEAERRKRIMTMNQKMSKMGPAGVRHRSLSEDDARSVEAFPCPPQYPYQPQYFNPPGPSAPSLRRVEVVGLSLPALQGKNGAASPVQHRKSSRAPQDRSSTMAKSVPHSRRHGDMWVSPDGVTSAQKTKNIFLHTDRYQWDDLLHSPDGLTQRDRLEIEEAYLERLRTLKRKRETVPHRETHELVMGGKKVIMCERMDIMGEIAKLKSVVLPARAKDLYVGKGFTLPQNHALNNPRGYISILRPFKKGEYFSPDTDGDERSPISVLRERGPVPQFSPLQVNLRIRRKPNNQDQVTTSKQLDKNKSKSAASVAPSVKSNVAKSPTKPARARSVPRSEGYAGDVSGESAVDVVVVGRNANVVPVSTAVSGVVSPTKSMSPTKGPPVNPLAIKGVENLVPDEDLEALRQTFQKLSTNTQGKVDFEELKSHLPDQLTDVELDYCKKVYEVSSSGNYFGEDEFVSLTCVCQKVTSLSGATKEAFQKVDISSVTDSINQYAELFQSVDRQQAGKISVDSLREILSTTTGLDLQSNADKFTEIKTAAGIADSTEISKTDYLALIPYFISQETKQ